MADHRAPSQQANPILENPYPHPALYQLQGQNPDVVGDYQEGVHREDIPRPVGNVVMQGEMQYPQHIGAPNYNEAHYRPPPPPYPQVPQDQYVHMHRDGGVANPVPAQAHPFAAVPLVQDVQENYDGYRAHFPAADPPEAFPGVWPYPAPPADMPPAANGLRNLVGHFLNNPGTRVNMLWIEPGPGGRFEVRIVLELADFF